MLDLKFGQQEIKINNGDRCYHKTYGYGEVLDVYKDDDNRLIVQARFASGFQYVNYDRFLESALAIFSAGTKYPTCKKCGKNPVFSAEEICFSCKKPDAPVVNKKVADVDLSEDLGIADDNALDEEKLEMGYLEDMNEDEGGTGAAEEDDDLLRHGFSYADYNK